MQFELTTNRSALGWDMYVFDCIEWHQLYQKCFKLLLLLLYSYHSLSNSNYCHRQFPCCLFFFHRAYFFVGCAHQCHIQMPYHLQFILRTSRIVYIVGKCVCTTFRTTPWWHRPNAYYCQTTTTLIVSLNRTKESEKGTEWKRQRERAEAYLRCCLFVLPIEWIFGPFSAFCHIIFYIVMEWVFCLHK